jgi:hypothetical protein
MKETKLDRRKSFEKNLMRPIISAVVCSVLHMSPVFSGAYDGPANGGWDNSLQQSPGDNPISMPSKIPAWSPANLTTAELHALRSFCSYAGSIHPRKN